MNLSRRNFVKAGGASVLAIAALSGSALSLGGSNDVMESLSAESFSSLIGSQFYIWNEQDSFTATLSKVDDFANASQKGKCFGLLFTTTKRRTVEGTFSVFNTETGNFELFLSASVIGRRGGYYATINRL